MQQTPTKLYFMLLMVMSKRAVGKTLSAPLYKPAYSDVVEGGPMKFEPPFLGTKR